MTTVLLKELTSFDLDYIRAAILIQGQSLLTSFSQTRGLFVGSVELGAALIQVNKLYPY